MFNLSFLWKLVSFPRINLSRPCNLIRRDVIIFSRNTDCRFRSSYSSKQFQFQFQQKPQYQPSLRFIKDTNKTEIWSFGFPFVIGSSLLSLVLTDAECQCKNKSKHSCDCECGKCESCDTVPLTCGGAEKKKPKNCETCTCSSESSKSDVLAEYHWSSQNQLCWKPDDLTHSFLTKQANAVTVDAVTRVLTETACAIEDYHEQYRVLINCLMELMEESRSAYDTRLELIECKMIVARSSLEDMKRNIIELECYMDSVSRLAHAAAETAFLASAEYASIAIMERLNSVNTQILCIQEKTKELERASTELQSLIIVESGRGLK